MRTHHYIFLFIFIFLLSAGLSGPYGHQKLPELETHEVTVHLVLVDVVAVDKQGQFVQDLKKEDFEIYEDGKKVPIYSFELISFRKETRSLPEAKVTEIPAHGRKKRLIVIFDSINTVKRELDRSKPKILERLVSLIKQGHEIMVLELQGKGGIKIFQPFTGNEILLVQAVKKASRSIWVDQASDVLYTPKIINQFQKERDDSYYGVKYRESQEVMYYYETLSRFEKTVTGLLSVLNMLKDYPGRKSVFLVSGGIPEMSIAKIFGTSISKESASSDLGLARIHDPFKVLGKSKRRYGDNIIKDLIDFANSHNISFYTMDPDNYLRHVLPDVSKDNYPRAVMDIRSAYPTDKMAMIERAELSNLNFLASGTGGLSLQGAKKFENFKKVVDQDLSGYYELSYIPPRKKGDGKYHKIKVTIRKPGLKIRSRPGYFDYTEEQNETLRFASASYNPSLFKDFSFEAWANSFIQGKDKFILWFNVALPLKKLIPGDYDREKPKTLTLKIWMEEEDIGLGKEMTMPIILTPETLHRLKGRPFFIFNCASGEINLKKENYRMIFAVHDEELSQTGTYEKKLNLPVNQKINNPQTATAFFGNLVERQRGGAAFQVSGEDSALLLHRYNFYPTEFNIFRRQASVALLTQFFVPDKKTSIEPGFVLFQRGQEKGDLPAIIIDKSWNKKASLWSIVYKLDFSATPPGSYVLDIKGNVDSSTLEADLRIKIL